MNCKNCGAEVGNEYRLCPYCRSELEYPTNNSQPPIIINNVMNNQNTNRNTNINYNHAHRNVISSKSKSTTLLLCLLGFIGLGGLHRFYVGKATSGIIYFLTMGGFLFGKIYDLTKITSDTFTDSNGLPIKK